MYNSNMQHFIDIEGNIPKQMPKEARELASFLALVIDTTTKKNPTTLTTTDIRCFNKRCHGLVKSSMRLVTNEIHWFCPNCREEGLISEWQKTK